MSWNLVFSEFAKVYSAIAPALVGKGVRGERRHKIGNISIPVNFLNKGYRNIVVEHNSALVFCTKQFLAGRTETVIHMTCWVAGHSTTARVPGIVSPFSLPLVTPETPIIIINYIFLNIVAILVVRMWIRSLSRFYVHGFFFVRVDSTVNTKNM